MIGADSEFFASIVVRDLLLGRSLADEGPTSCSWISPPNPSSGT
jgi:hypothetical protein